MSSCPFTLHHHDIEAYLAYLVISSFGDDDIFRMTDHIPFFRACATSISQLHFL